MKFEDHIINWLLEGDISIKYQTYRDLLNIEYPSLQNKILKEGWGKAFMDKRNDKGFWGGGFYQPKWISSHYTLLDIRHLCPHQEQPEIIDIIRNIALHHKSKDGGVNPAGTIKESDVCVNGMFMYYACYFGLEEELVISIIDFILRQRLKDGGFNCMLNRSGARHSSLHSTLSLLEGMTEYIKNGYTYRQDDIKKAIHTAKEFILMHQLFISDRTGKIIKESFLRFPFPPRWKYDILRAMDYFQNSDTIWDERMKPAMEVLLKKRKKDGTWNQYAGYSGLTHFEMEKAGKPGRWNTLRALRVLKKYN